MWICHTATPRALLAMPATCKDVAAATRASGKARDRQRCCRGHGGRRESAKPPERCAASGRRRRRFERTGRGGRTRPRRGASRYKVDRRTGRYRRPRAGEESCGAAKAKLRARASPGKASLLARWKAAKAGPEVAVGSSATRSCRRRGRANLQSRVVDCDCAARVDSGALPAQARRGLTPARSP